MIRSRALAALEARRAEEAAAEAERQRQLEVKNARLRDAARLKLANWLESELGVEINPELIRAVNGTDLDGYDREVDCGIAYTHLEGITFKAHSLPEYEGVVVIFGDVAPTDNPFDWRGIKTADQLGELIEAREAPSRPTDEAVA
jgi:threonine dehydrogenase-like Zn-dependent dehydrogenase